MHLELHQVGASLEARTAFLNTRHLHYPIYLVIDLCTYRVPTGAPFRPRFVSVVTMRLVLGASPGP